MRVILLQDIKALGRQGDVKNVADGYARNFLLPKKLVKLATPAAIQETEKEKSKLEAQLASLKVGVEDMEKATAAEPLTFEIRVGERGEIFGSISAHDIKVKLIERYPKLADSNLIIEEDHIRELGRREIGIKARRTPKSGFATSGQVTIEVLPQQL
ncbi:MAG: 50S ribosomal protein L9 [Candidatus Colwellbacteria bacterium]|nr:50S ribosomal protein L9 [Candidatus Colwellbacteria bacterium]